MFAVDKLNRSVETLNSGKLSVVMSSIKINNQLRETELFITVEKRLKPTDWSHGLVTWFGHMVWHAKNTK